MAAEINPDETPTLSHHNIARNASIYFVGQVTTWLVNIITLSIIPRTLGEEAMGQFAFAMSTVMTIQLLLMLGGEMYLTKEVGRDREEAGRLISALLGLRLALIPVMTLLCVLSFAILKVGTEVWHLGGILIVASAIALLADPLRAVLLGWEHAKQVSMLDIVFALVPLCTIPFLRYGVMTQAVSFVVSNFIVLLLRLRWIHRIIPIRPAFHPAMWREIINGGLPFVINSLMLSLSSFIAVTQLQWQANLAAVGVYAQAKRLFGTFLFVPTALGMALLPSLSRLAEVGQEEFRRLQSRVMALLIILSLPVMTTILVLAKPISQLLYGTRAFVDMPLVLQISALAIMPMYLVTAMYQFLVAQDRGRAWTGFLVASIVLYVGAAGVLIPFTLKHYNSGAVGAVGATAISELCSVIFAFLLLKNNPLNRETLSRIARACLAAAGMGAIMWVTREAFILFPLILGFLVFGVLAWILRVLSLDEQQKILSLFRRLLRRKSRIASESV